MRDLKRLVIAASKTSAKSDAELAKALSVVHHDLEEDSKEITNKVSLEPHQILTGIGIVLCIAIIFGNVIGRVSWFFSFNFREFFYAWQLYVLVLVLRASCKVRFFFVSLLDVTKRYNNGSTRLGELLLFYDFLEIKFCSYVYLKTAVSCSQ